MKMKVQWGKKQKGLSLMSGGAREELIFISQLFCVTVTTRYRLQMGECVQIPKSPNPFPFLAIKMTSVINHDHES